MGSVARCVSRGFGTDSSGFVKERKHKNQDNQYDVVKSNYKEEFLQLRKLNQDMLIQVKKLKQENKSLQEKLGCKGSLIDKEMMTDAIEKSSKGQIQTSEKGSNTKLVNAQIQKNNHIVTSLQASTKNGSQKQSQKLLNAPKVEVPKNTSQANRVPYRHPNHKSNYD